MEINTASTDTYPYLQILKSVFKAPASIYFSGALPSIRVPSVAIVGSRKPTAYGKEITFTIARDLANAGVMIISGLALGIDSIAHKATLDAGGKTIAVLPGGLDSIYPSSHRQLARQIVESGGALLTEHPEGTKIYKNSFLSRNRLISGLADAVIVTEATSRSGTLATVTYALEQGKEVFAVPGNITSELSVGPNNLIKQGAHPITSANDVLEIIAPHLIQKQTMLTLGSNQQETTLLGLIQSGIRDGDDLLQQSGLSASLYLQTMTMLEIDEKIRPLGANQWTIK